MRLLNGSGMSWEVHVPFCERLKGWFLWPTHHKMHWCLDVAFNEENVEKDQATQRKTFQHLALNLLKSEGTKKSIKRKKKSARWDEDYLTRILLNDGKTTKLDA